MNTFFRTGSLTIGLIAAQALWPTFTPATTITIAASHCTNSSPTEATLIAKLRGKASRQSQKLTLKTGRGSVTFNNKCQDENYVQHTLVTYYADVRYFLVHSVSIEYNEYQLVNAKTGVKTTIYSRPVFSPDRQRFTSMVIDELNGLTSVEIYRLTNTGMRQEYKNTKIHGPANPIWKNNSTINFRRTLTLGSDPTPAVLQRKNGTWKLI